MDEHLLQSHESESGLAVSAVLGPNHVQELYNFKRLDEVGNWRTWQPAKFKSSDGATFFLCCVVVNKVAYFWIYFMGSPHDAKKYAITLTASGKTNAKFTYHGNVHTLGLSM